MHIMRLIKNYFFTSIFIISFLITIPSFMFPTKLNALSVQKANPYCNCEKTGCNENVPSEEQKNCMRDQQDKCVCPGPDQYKICDNSWMIECTRVDYSPSLSCCDKPSDCDPPYCNILGPNTPHTCSRCVIYSIPKIQCMGCSAPIRGKQCDDPGSQDCGKCNYQPQ